MPRKRLEPALGRHFCRSIFSCYRIVLCPLRPPSIRSVPQFVVIVLAIRACEGRFRIVPTWTGRRYTFDPIPVKQTFEPYARPARPCASLLPQCIRPAIRTRPRYQSHEAGGCVGGKRTGGTARHAAP